MPIESVPSRAWHVGVAADSRGASDRSMPAITTYRVDPITDPRWADFLNAQDCASVFHSVGWLQALQLTYGYEPFALTTSAPSERLKNALVFCRIRSWLTGNRMVSLPFADHCQPLVESPESMEALLTGVREEQARASDKYIELRPRNAPPDTAAQWPLKESSLYYFHTLDLRPDRECLFSNLHKSCVQRKIQRAEREQLKYERGRSEELLARFYKLLLLTRRRHQLPPQPMSWFRNLLDSLGEEATIHVASKAGQPVASIFTLRFKRTLVYKYGGSDQRFHKLGGMPFLFWKAIEEAKQRGDEEFDLGRSDRDNEGLVSFKEHLGATRSTLAYFSYPEGGSAVPSKGWKMRLLRSTFEWMPDSLLATAGRLLYKHVG
ncbi:MAG: lipid II:glycine glycyltransferase FemX [Terriglobales bacterium]